MVVDPLTPLSDAVHVLEAELAVKTSCPDALMFWMLVELVTDPAGPSVPCVLTSIWSELKTVATAARTRPLVRLAVIGTADPVAGRVTEGSGPVTSGGPPKWLTLAKYP
jgi:hypothetical protein